MATVPPPPPQEEADAVPVDKMNELERIKKECEVMVRHLKDLETKERELAEQNRILARETLLCGFNPRLLEPPAPKRRKSSVRKADGN